MTQKDLIDYCNSLGGQCSLECRYDNAECEAFAAKYGTTPYISDELRPELYTDEVVETVEAVETAEKEGTTACSTDDTISRRVAIEALAKQMPEPYTPDGSHPADEGIFQVQEVYADCIETLELLPSVQPEPKYIPCSERLPEERDWYLGIFKEPDTGWINPLPFICDYLLGKKTKATTKEGWILRGFTDREEYIDYYFDLECVAWMPMPKPYKEAEKHGTD